MPIISHEVTETIEAVTRPVIYAVARNLLQRTGLSLDASVYLNKGDGQARSLNSGLKEAQDEASFAQDKSRIQVSMEEEYMDDDMLESKIPDSNTNPAFIDPVLGISIRPIYYQTRITLTIEMYFKSESAGSNWVNGIRRRVGNGRQGQKHTAEYHFAIPEVLMSVLAELYTLRENNAGYGETFSQYLKNNFSHLVTVITNQAGTKSQFAVKEKQTGFNGWFSFEKPPELVQNTQQFSASFSYTFEYQKPAAFVMSYPLMVHNQLVPKKLRLMGENYNMLVDPNHADYTKSRFMRLQGGPIVPGQSIGGISVPNWDEWLPQRVRRHYSTLLRCMLMVGNDPRELMNLDNIPNLQIDPILREYMVKHHTLLTTSYAHPFQVVLYKDGLPLREDALVVDENFNVWSTFDLNPRHQYHLWIGCMTDLSMLSDNGVDGLIADGEVTKQVIRVVDSTYDISKVHVLDDGSISLPRWNKIKTELKESYKRYTNRYENNTLTVGQFTVTAQNLGRD